MKYNMADVYKDRIEEIDKQLKAAVLKKKWTEVKQLREEKKGLLQKINEMGART